MGNQITAIAPAQILPLENYFNDLTDYGKPNSLGSTRFLKVARSTHRDRVEMVVKVFAKNDPSLHLKPHENRLYDIRVKLHGVANALPFQKFWETDKAAYLVRQFIHFNLYDRISTRPFLSVMEKRWIAFQLLKALDECHVKKICHGDIKTENVLLTGWDWVLLTDFASFKPILLPADNPADYSFFFDTSRRRTCYVAPERFVDDSSNINSSRLSLTQAMDVFALGCVIGELFTDGRQLFDLSQLLELRARQSEYTPETLLKKISDKPVRRMIRHMIQRDPEERFTAEAYLKVYKGDVFPEFFYSFLHDYFKQFSVTTQLTPDQCIQKLYSDIEAILANLLLNRRNEDREMGYGDALVIILSAITSHLRLTQFASSKLQALEMMKRISHHISDECILERTVPYLVLLLKDKLPSVRAEAIRTLTHCLCLVRHLPRSDVNLFPEYILPSLTQAPSDKDVMVKIAFAECVADLAKSAHRFLELAQLQANQDADEASVIMQYQVQGSYDSELTQLQQSFQSRIVHLLTDSESLVKKAFLRHSAGKLCVFFGPLRANEAILSHMITFLNDKSDWDLHAAFFESIVIVARLLGHRSLPILEPLVQQGLSSPEETVVCKTIAAVTSMTESKLFDHRHLMMHIKLISPFFVHPNIWVCYEAVGFLCIAAHQMDEIDVECYITPVIRTYFKHPVFQLKDEWVVLSALKEPVPRGVLDYLLKQQNIHEIFSCLKERQRYRKYDQPLEQPQDQIAAMSHPTPVGHLAPIFRRLQTLGLNEEHENSLLELRGHLLKQCHNKQLYADQDPHGPRGVVNCRSLSHVNSRQQKLTYGHPLGVQPLFSSPSVSTKRSSGSKASSGSDPKSEDWDRIFGSEQTPMSKLASQRGSQPTLIPTSTPHKLHSLSHQIPTSTLPHKLHSSQRHTGTVQGDRKGSVVSVDSQSLLSVRSLAKEEISRSTDDALNRPRPTEDSTEGGGRRQSRHKRCRSEGSAASTTISLTNSSPPPPPPPSLSPSLSPQSVEGKEGVRQGKKEREMSPPYTGRQRKAVETTSCTEGLKRLLDYKQAQYAEDMKAMDNELVKNTCFQASGSWTPKGQLIAHIHEHKESINRVRVLPDSTVFATFSNDGTTKLWDVQKLEGRNLINKAKLSYTQLGGQVKTGVFCLNNTAIAAASSNGNIHIFPVDIDKEKKRSATSASTLSTISNTSGGRVKPLQESYVDPSENGLVIDMAHFTAGGQNVLCYATTKGRLCGLDLRSNDTVWSLTNNPKFGLVLSMAVDPYENWVALGTSLGYHVIWDMRFQLPIRHWQHTGHQKSHVHAVYQLNPHPTDPPSLISAVTGNNEVSIWDMETATRRQMLWASPAPPFGEMTDKLHQQESVRGLTACVFDDHPVVLTGGTDRIIRLWDLRDPAQCCCVTKPKHLKRVQFEYQSKVIEGVEVTKELAQSVTSSGNSAGSDTPPSSESPSQYSHIDFITDLSLVTYKNQQFIVSASHDGVLKLWK